MKPNDPGFRLIPVLDLLNGQAVHAVRGQRSQYKPLTGKYAPTSNPDQVLLALERILPERVAYVADLDRILKQGCNFQLLEAAIHRGWTFWLDAGLTEGMPPFRAGIIPIAGTETVISPKALQDVIQNPGSPGVVSIDLQGGFLLRQNHSSWPSEPPLDLIKRVADLGAKRLILLDLAVVGSGQGPAHLELACQALKSRPDLEIFLGGGIRSPEDLENCRKAGLAGALVATALQSGALDLWLACENSPVS